MSHLTDLYIQQMDDAVRTRGAPPGDSCVPALMGGEVVPTGVSLRHNR